ncbi:hypothetical protein K435DRAFT_865751 [Dendrothele bispora CBS 962.96]|uniref:Uncharacterized protein n=1 Tax=Dendrothele bispora (strain CBS 962.96) TaxID=1314807 RepID=A0A4S8LJF0_DENBC|nr:hypothetical protein K435DRAFT_865751 [Dendrothele bispora CBS 962.96]
MTSTRHNWNSHLPSPWCLQGPKSPLLPSQAGVKCKTPCSAKSALVLPWQKFEGHPSRRHLSQGVLDKIHCYMHNNICRFYLHMNG